MGKGIDYGMGTTNIDRETGIRYGVIHSHALDEWWHESFEDDYGDPACPECGGPVVEYDEEKHGQFGQDRGCSDAACIMCEKVFGTGDTYGDECIGADLDDGEYVARLHQDGDIFILKSPYKTRAQFCSPCAPGAVHLENPDEDGEWGYCFDASWFTDDKPPYDVYSVATGELVTKAHVEGESETQED